MANRAVLRPPGRAARGLAEWAVDLWPYVNGKALTLGLNLKEMELPDMLDVLHYLLEEDLRYHSPEEYESTNSVRTYMYENLYGQKYAYKGESITKNQQKGGRSYIDKNASWDSLPDEFSVSTEVKPYIPPTPVDPDSALPFGGVLDTPLR